MTDSIFRLAAIALREVYDLTKDERIHSLLEQLAIIKRGFDVKD